MNRTNNTSVTYTIYMCGCLMLALYFGYSAVRGDLGVLESLVIESKLNTLVSEKSQLEVELAELRNLSTRLSDQFLDLDLLDERARATLGMLRDDELVIEETTIRER